MNDGQVLTEWSKAGDADIATVVVDRPAKLNALHMDLSKELAASFVALRDTHARAVVLTGAGDKAFIGGADINTLKSLNPSSARTYITSIHEVCAAIRSYAVPVVARVNGYALGAGLEIAAACDMRIAEATAVMGMPEVKVGLPSVVEAALLPTLIGWGRARWMLMTGENIDASTGARWGLIDILADAGKLDTETATTVASIASAAPYAMRVQKRLMRDWERLSLSDSIDAGIEAFVECYEAGSEPQDYVNAFLAKRKGG